MTDELKAHSLETERWREYDFHDRIYRIEDPAILYLRPGGTTHRVVDASGVVHLVPAPGFEGCVVRWKPRTETDPVQF